MSKAMKKTVSAWALAGASVLAIATGAIAADRPAELAPLGDPPIPADNPQTPEKIELGKLLFFDPRLSGNGSMPCSACHLPDAGWDFPDKISLGYPGTVHWRNSQTIVNSAYYGNLFWAGSSKSLEAQAKSAAKGAVAGNGEDDMMEARLAFIPEYRERFKDVFGTEYPRLGHAWMAIAAFERTLVQTDTPFDNYMRGDDTALDDAQKRGLELFTGKAGCSQCHNGALLTNEKYYNLGVPPYDGWETDELAQITFRYELYAKGSTEEMYRSYKDDPGVYFRAKDKEHLGKFRVPSLRYTKYTAPYMHNGMIATLEDVVEFYNQGGGENQFAKTKSELIKPLGLNDQEKADLVAFLESLSGERIVMEEPELPEYDVLPTASN
ncbi:MAG: cytochrome c peroxidase [Pseudomonadota bacterium]